MLVAMLASAAAAATPAPVAARVEARATVRIVRGTAVRFNAESMKDMPPATSRTVRDNDGTLTLARLIEFQ